MAYWNESDFKDLFIDMELLRFLTSDALEAVAIGITKPKIDLTITLADEPYSSSTEMNFKSFVEFEKFVGEFETWQKPFGVKINAVCYNEVAFKFMSQRITIDLSTDKAMIHIHGDDQFWIARAADRFKRNLQASRKAPFLNPHTMGAMAAGTVAILGGIFYLTVDPQVAMIATIATLPMSWLLTTMISSDNHKNHRIHLEGQAPPTHLLTHSISPTVGHSMFRSPKSRIASKMQSIHMSD
jgi:hypothetical protein